MNVMYSMEDVLTIVIILMEVTIVHVQWVMNLLMRNCVKVSIAKCMIIINKELRICSHWNKIVFYYTYCSCESLFVFIIYVNCRVSYGNVWLARESRIVMFIKA